MASSSSSPWSGLPEDIVASIIDHLLLPDYISFAAACRSWNSVAAPSTGLRLKRKLSLSTPEQWGNSLPNKKQRHHLTEAEVSDIRKARPLLKSVTRTDPKHSPGWIAAARLEEVAGEIEAARQWIQNGLRELPEEEDLWLEASRLETNDKEKKRVVLLKGIRNLPGSARLLLSLARIVTYDEAKKVLNMACLRLPKEPAVWIAAAELQEANGNTEASVGRVIERGMRRLIRKGAAIDREAWMKEAEAAEQAGLVLTCQAIVYNAIGIGFGGDEEQDGRLIRVWLERFPSMVKLWLMLGKTEDRLGHKEEAEQAYELGLNNCPDCVPLWLALASLEERIHGLSKARQVLAMAREKNSENPELWLAAVRAEARHGNRREADRLMAEALQECPASGILWAASIEMVPLPQLQKKCVEAIQRSLGDPCVIAAVARLFWQHREVDRARSWFDKAVTIAPEIGDLWAFYYKFKLRHGSEQSQEVVLQRCAAAEPRRGEKWTAISIENSHLQVEAILEKTVAALRKEENSMTTGNRRAQKCCPIFL